MISIASYVMTGLAYVFIVCMFFARFNKEAFDEMKTRVFIMVSTIVFLISFRTVVYIEIIFIFDINHDGCRSFLTLRVFRRCLQVSEFVMSGFIFFIAFRNYQNSK